jgi:hypothetical protein
MYIVQAQVIVWLTWSLSYYSSPPPPSPTTTLSRRKRDAWVGGWGGEVGRELRPSVTNWTARQLHTWYRTERYRAAWRWSLRCKNLEVSVKIILGLKVMWLVSVWKIVLVHAIKIKVSESQFINHEYVCIFAVSQSTRTPWKTITCSTEIIFFKHTFNATVSRDFSCIDSVMNGWSCQYLCLVQLSWAIFFH